MLATRVKLPVGFSWRELLQSSLAAMDATSCRVYLTPSGDGAIAQVAVRGNGLPGTESARLALQVILGGQVVVVEPAPPCAAEPKGVSVAVGAPLEVEGQTRGAVVIGFPTGNNVHCEGNRVGLALLLARLVATYLWCAELRQTLAQREEHLDQLMRSTIEAQEAEREWICLEVHDGMAQTMVSAFQHLQAYEAMPSSRLKEARPHILRAAALVRQAIGESREVINSITPAPLSELGLVATLRQELRRFEEDTGCTVQFDAPAARLPREMEVALYRIVHEAVTNVKKHAQAKSLEVEICQDRRRVSIRIKDSGVGFDPNLPQGRARGGGRGLFSMRKRAEILGGVCEVKSQPGQGTEVTVDLPLLPGKRA